MSFRVSYLDRSEQLLLLFLFPVSMAEVGDFEELLLMVWFLLGRVMIEGGLLLGLMVLLL